MAHVNASTSNTIPIIDVGFTQWLLIIFICSSSSYNIVGTLSVCLHAINASRKDFLRFYPQGAHVSIDKNIKEREGSLVEECE